MSLDKFASQETLTVLRACDDRRSCFRGLVEVDCVPNREIAEPSLITPNDDRRHNSTTHRRRNSGQAHLSGAHLDHDPAAPAAITRRGGSAKRRTVDL